MRRRDFLTGLAAAGVLDTLTGCTTSTRPKSRHVLSVPDGFAGVAMASRGGELLLSHAAGLAGGKPIRTSDRFWIASAGKQFAAVALLVLVDAGRLKIDDPLSRFIADASSDKAAITVRQLLAHNSGFGQSYASEKQPDRAAAVRAMLAEPLKAAPGSGFLYSNSNTQMVAAIVETVSGRAYSDFVRGLWRDAGLVGTGLAGDEGSGAVLPALQALPPRLAQSFWGEQGVYSTASDLLRWRSALAKGRILKPETVALMLAPAARTGEGYATLGWFRGTTARGSDVVYVRGNEDFGANALLYFYPASDVAIAVVSHAGDSPSGQSWSRNVLNSLEIQLAL